MSQLCTALVVVGLGVGACKAPDLPENVKWVDAPTYETHEPYFPINSGKHEGANCNKCHGDFDTFSQFTCISCHEHEQTDTDTIHTAVPEYEYSATSCFQCHPRGEAEGTGVNHQAYYPIGEGTTHEPLGCSDCHIVPGDRTQVSCIDCHDHAEAAMATQHGGTPGYAWQTQACLDCHRDGDALSRDVHDPIFPISVQTLHKDSACADCHVDANDKEVISCVDCHAHESAPTQNEHVGVGGYGYITRDCMKCHFDASVPKLEDHGPFLIDAESKHKAEEAACLDCHPDELPDRPFASADFRSSYCLGCHLRPDTDPDHEGELNYRYDNQACLECHMDGKAVSRISHDPTFPISMTTAHAAEACAGCHTDTIDSEAVTCVDCHAHETAATQTAHVGVGGYGYNSGQCMKCHFDASVPRLQDHGGFVVTTESKHGPADAECLTCHLGELPNRPFPSADFEGFECRGCHQQTDMDPIHVSLADYRFNNPSCINCHPDGQVISRTNHDPVFPISTGTAHEGTDCDTCHMGLLNDGIITCTGCHPHEQAASLSAHSGVGGYRFESVLCMKCHDESGVARLTDHLPFRINANNKHGPADAECLQCHTQLNSARPFPAADFEIFDCLGCHEHSRARMDDKHLGEVSGYSYDSLTCVGSRCHPDGREQ